MRGCFHSRGDLIVLRTARALAVANVPYKRITKSIRELRRHLPESMPLSGLSICAVADRVVVEEGGSRWQAESGQYLLAFESDADGSISVIEAVSAEPAVARNRTSLMPRRLKWKTLMLLFGRTSKQSKRIPRYSTRASTWAACCTSAAGYHTLSASIAMQSRCGDEALLLFNFGVLLDDMGRKSEAIKAYEAALRTDPGLADCHYNVALLYEDLKKPKDALRHMAQYRRLLGTKPR